MSLSPNEETSIHFSGEWDHPLAVKLQDAWFAAIAMNHKLPDSVRYMEGMSGKKYRYLINNLVGSIEDARYLEIGSWKGSTASAAIYGNKCKALCIDNWSSFLWGAPKEAVRGVFETNVRAAAGDTCDFSFIDQDFRTVDYSNIGKFNVYMFDGPHEEKDQFDGVDLVKGALDDTYILVVDDYNWGAIRKGTEDALAQAGHKVLAKVEIFTWIGDGHPAIAHQNSDWHDGYMIAVCSKV
jgi:hypothetical protein